MSANDLNWLEELYRAHYERLCKFTEFKLRNYGAPPDEAHDIVQDVFLLAEAKDLQHHPFPVSWIYATIDYCCRNYTRTHFRNLAKTFEFEKLHVPFQSPEISEWELLSTLEKELSSLDYYLIKAFILDRIPAKELSAQTSLSENAIYIRIHRIRKQIKALFLISLLLLHARFLR